MKLSIDFPDQFASLPDHITKGLEKWQEVFKHIYYFHKHPT